MTWFDGKAEIFPNADTFTLQSQVETITWTLSDVLISGENIESESPPDNNPAGLQGDFKVFNVAVTKTPEKTTTVEPIFFQSPDLGETVFMFGFLPSFPADDVFVKGQLWTGQSNAPIFNLGTFEVLPVGQGANPFTTLTVANAPEVSTIIELLFGLQALFMAYRFGSWKRRSA